ncbi:MAG TPA: HAD-IB family hydrolase, partial [Actinomycetota bacterium]|nr:HAD-IB family hydrolase [Actinomycetota bacterium]
PAQRRPPFILARMTDPLPDGRAPRCAAFFDLDKTLIPGSSLFLLARGLYERDLFRVRDILRFARGQLAFRLFGERESGIEMSRVSTLEFVAGRSQAEIVSWGREIAEERILPLVYQDIVEVIEKHRGQGHLTFLVTAAPVELAGTLAEGLRMTGALGTVAEVDDEGRYTGRLAGPVMHGEEKAKAVARAASERGLDLEQCAAYSDSVNDLPLLELVGHPHAVNPERELRRIARLRGWPVHELRTRRRALLVGVPAGLGGASLMAAGNSRRDGRGAAATDARNQKGAGAGPPPRGRVASPHP